MSLTKASQVKLKRSEAHYNPMIPVIAEMLERDCSCQKIADELNERQFKTMTGTKFTAANVYFLVKRSRERGLLPLHSNRLEESPATTDIPFDVP